MAERRLKLVDDVFADLPTPETADEARKLEGQRKIVDRWTPAIIKKARPGILAEGERNAYQKLGILRIEEASQIASIRAEHAEQLAHVKKHWGRAEGWRSAAIGFVIALMAFAGGIWYGGYLTTNGFSLRVASERVCRVGQDCGPPTLDYEPSTDAYERGRGEPGNAQ